MVRDLNPTWRIAHVVENRAIARGSMWLTLEAQDDEPVAFKPGHVLGLGIKQADGEYLRHAYTVTCGDSRRRRFSHVYRVILEGQMTPEMSRMQQGASISFHGPAHKPIQREVHPEAEQIVGWATGTGIGPLYGYSEKTLAEGEKRPVALYLGMREEADICLKAELDSLCERHTNFSYRFALTKPASSWQGLRGRLTDTVPPLLRNLGNLHVHLIGNGEMVHLVRPALIEAGMARDRVSIETYFNHDAKPDPGSIESLAERLRAGI